MFHERAFVSPWFLEAESRAAHQDGNLQLQYGLGQGGYAPLAEGGQIAAPPRPCPTTAPLTRFSHFSDGHTLLPGHEAQD